MRPEADLLAESAELLFDEAPCGYLATRLDGTIIKANRTFATWTGLERDTMLIGRRFQDLLGPGGRIYYETHFIPLLQMQGSVREIAVEITRGDGSTLPALVNSTWLRDDTGHAQLIQTTVFDATDRRRYEQELLRASRRQHDIALTLQRSLLSGELPVSRAVEFDVVYVPAGAGLEAGGDWYDAFWMNEGHVISLVVGDVVGRGITAAATMGQLRSAVRALALTGLRPAALLSALSEYSRRHSVGQMTTLVCAQLELDTRTLYFACAGHPPPLILPAAGDPYFDWEGRSPPLDAFPTDIRDEARRVLEHGDTLLLYTDGLTDSRATPDVDGLSRMREALTDRAGRSREDHVRAVLRELDEPDSPDDVCLLAAYLT